MFRNKRGLVTYTTIAIILYVFVGCAGPKVVSQSPQLPFDWKPSEATVGAILSHKELERSDDKGEVSYKFFASGVPQEQRYEMWNKRIDGIASKLLDNIKVEDSGELVVPVKGEEYKLIMTLEDMLEAEPIYYALVSKDKSIKAFDEIFPFPIKVTSKDGCQIELRLMTVDRRNFSMIAKGFEPNEKVKTRSVSGGELIVHEIQASPGDGGFIIVMNPGVVGKNGGTATFSATGRSCDVSLIYRWGKAMLRGGLTPSDR